MEIFVSYSRRDADFAQHVYDYFEESEHVIFTDVNNIQMGDIWSDIIKDNISKCDVFAMIVTFASIRSKYIEREVLQAQRENKLIIPCFYKDIVESDVIWDLSSYQGVKFEDKYDLALELYSKIAKRKTPIFSSLSNINKIQQQDNSNIYPEINTLDQPKPQTSSRCCCE